MRTPFTSWACDSGTTIIERAPTARQASRATRESASLFEQMSKLPVRKHSPVIESAAGNRSPTQSVAVPAPAVHTISSPSSISMQAASLPTSARASLATAFITAMASWSAVAITVWAATSRSRAAARSRSCPMSRRCSLTTRRAPVPTAAATTVQSTTLRQPVEG
jgi:hypothetical protein